jgi:hypothetical protein
MSSSYQDTWKDFYYHEFFREIWSKTTMKCHYSSMKKAEIKKTEHIKYWWQCGGTELWQFAGENTKGTAIVKKRLAIS